jgi:hypothetical protein
MKDEHFQQIRDEYLQQMKDILIRVEGTINVLHKPDVIVAHRKLQGLRDKVRHMIQRVAASNKPQGISLENNIQEVISDDINKNEIL